MLDKKIGAVQNDLKKSQQQSQFSTMLPLLISQPPKLESFTAQSGVTTTITDTKYKSGDSTGLLLAMMAMGGGLGGGSGGDMNNSLILAMALGAFK